MTQLIMTQQVNPSLMPRSAKPLKPMKRKKGKPKKRIRIYEVNVDMQWSESYTVKAKTPGEARKKAWAKFSKNPPRKNFDILADEMD